MNTTVITKTYDEPPFCIAEILRYSGCKNQADDVTNLLNICVDEVHDVLSYKVCYRRLSVRTCDSLCDFDYFTLQSEHLAKLLRNCDSAIIFGATIGIGIDRLIAKHGRISPAKALMIQAIGAERIEALCDAFENDIKKEINAEFTPRFSPGYGDLPLNVQKNIFSILDCSKKIGLTLNDSMLMSPSKSVTAFIGLKNK